MEMFVRLSEARTNFAIPKQNWPFLVTNRLLDRNAFHIRGLNYRLAPSLFRDISALRNIVTSAVNLEEDAAIEKRPLQGLRPCRSNYVP